LRDCQYKIEIDGNMSVIGGDVHNHGSTPLTMKITNKNKPTSY